MTMTEARPREKEQIRIAETDVVYSDENGDVHLKTAELSKSGGSSDDE